MSRNLAQMCLTHAWGGMEMACVEYAELFQARGATSFGICLAGSPTEKHFHLPREHVLSLGREGYFSPLQSYQIRKFIKRHKIEAVMCHQLKDLWFLYPAIRGLGVKVYGFAHMFLRDINKKDALHRKVYGQLSKLIALSETQLEGLMNCLPIERERTVIIPNGVDLKRFGPERRSEDLRRLEFRARPDQLVIGVVGRLDPQKGQMEFVEAAAALAKDHPDLRFIFIGKENADGVEFRLALEARIRELGLADQFVLVGHRPDVSEYMASLDIFALPSYEEAFGKVTIEAMACQLAIVGTRSGSTPEILSGGECGVLVEPHSAGDLARGLRELVENPSRRRALATAARLKAEKQFALDKVLDELAALVLQ